MTRKRLLELAALAVAALNLIETLVGFPAAVIVIGEALRLWDLL